MADVVEILEMYTGSIVRRWSDDDHARHRTDWGGHLDEGRPCAIAFPRSTDEVAAVVRACTANGVAVVPQGGLTGMAGGAVPPAGALVLSLERMNAIREVNNAGSYMVVEAGVPLQRVQEVAAEADLLFPLDLGARGSALIGGNLATNAGGNRVLRYGMVRDLTLGIEVVLPDGTIVDAMNCMAKNNAGYDLKQLFIGSEGTLGIITAAVLKLHPLPRTQHVALCALDSYSSVLKLLAHARENLGGALTAFEVMWDDYFEFAASTRERQIGLEGPNAYVVLVETMGRDVEKEAGNFQDFVEQAFEAGLITNAMMSQNSRDVDDFWAIRDASGELGQHFGNVVNFDVGVRVEELDDFARECRRRIKDAFPSSQVFVFGHIADGNIHFACVTADPKNNARTEEIIYEAVGEWRGSITAEHGVGLEKRAFLHHSRPPSYIALMRTVKQALDPHNLMNPGKIFL